MKLDIGSAEGPMPADYIHLDIQREYVYATAEELGYKPVDIIADAHYLPFRDGVFDEVYSGNCVLVYTGKRAFDEAVRVLKPKGKLVLHIIASYVPMAIIEAGKRHKLKWIDIEPVNHEIDGEIFDVKLTFRKERLTNDWFFDDLRKPDIEYL